MAEPWTRREENILRQHFGTVGREELLQLLPLRAYPHIKQKAVRLGLLHVPTEAELRERVEAGQSLRQMGRVYNLDGKTIHRYCRKYGIELRSQPEATSIANRRELPKRLFRAPLSPDQSWLVGIIASDGNIAENGRLRVHSVDDDIIHHCRRIAQVGYIYLRTPASGSVKAQHEWAITSVELPERLARFGIHPRKSFTLGFPEPADLHMPSFVRGLWDGDGYWRVDKRGYFAGGFGCSSKEFIEVLWEYLKPVAESRAKVYKHPSKEHWVIRVDKQRALRLAAWMYQHPCDAYCERKREVVTRTAAPPPAAVDPLLTVQTTERPASAMGSGTRQKSYPHCLRRSRATYSLKQS